MSDTAQPLAELLSACQTRILGALVEKQLTTPEAYPLTLNALQLACNQTTSRQPLMNLEQGEILGALRHLEDLGLVRLQMGKRADRWEQRFEQTLSLTPQQTGLLALLMLRGPQTLAELFSRSTRLHPFDDQEQLRHALERLSARGLVTLLAKQSGQREERYQQSLSAADVQDTAEPQVSSNREDKDQRIASLESRLAELEQRLATLESQLS